MGLFLGPLSYALGLCVCFYASPIHAVLNTIDLHFCIVLNQDKYPNIKNGEKILNKHYQKKECK